MRSLALLRDAAEPVSVLCLGAHSDDIEIGCGGTLLKFRQSYPNCKFDWVVFSAEGVRKAEAERAATLFAGADLNRALFKAFQDGFMPFQGAQIKSAFEELKSNLMPDLIFTHNRRDAHQDHRILAELTWNTFRDHLILEYEIPKYDGDIGRPNLFVPLDAQITQQKTDLLMNTFQSQRQKHWFDRDTFLSLMRLRGIECNSQSGYAEAFYCHKVVL